MIFETIDLTTPVDAEAVRSTIAKLAESGQLAETLAGRIDRAGIVSFFDSELGQLAQQAGSTVLREWPFTYALDASAIGTDSGETVILQGIIDMIIPTPDGLTIVDFKTDRVTGSQIEDRAEKYAKQLRLYTKAAADILNQPITAAWLYFLTPQKAIPIEISRHQ